MTNKIKLVYDTSKVQPKDWAGYHGEDIELEVGFVNYGQPCEIPDGATATYYYRDDTMEPGTWHSAPAVISGDKAVVHWSAEVDGGADVNTWFLGINDGGELLYKATGRMRLYSSPGFVPSVLPPALQVLDFDRYDVRNAPYYTKPETDTLLAAKADAVHGHAVSDVDGLQAALDGKLSTADGAVGTANIANSAVTDAKIANNSVTWDKLGTDAKNTVNGKLDKTGGNIDGTLSFGDDPESPVWYLDENGLHKQATLLQIPYNSGTYTIATQEGLAVKADAKIAIVDLPEDDAIPGVAPRVYYIEVDGEHAWELPSLNQGEALAWEIWVDYPSAASGSFWIPAGSTNIGSEQVERGKRNFIAWRAYNLDGDDVLAHYNVYHKESL